MSTIIDLLGTQAGYYLDHVCKTIDKKLIISRAEYDRQGMGGFRQEYTHLGEPASLYGHGRLANTGYVSILPVDQGIEHSAGASFAPNPLTSIPGTL